MTIDQDLALPVFERVAPRRPAAPSPPAAPWLFALWMGTAAAMAATAGLVLGVFAALATGPAAERWTQSVQAHGRVQLFGFLAPFVAALLLEFLPRLYQRPHPAARWRVAVPGALVARSLLGGFGHASGAVMGPLLFAGSVLQVVGAVGLVAAVWSLRPARDWKRDPQALFLLVAPVWLLAATIISWVSVAHAEDGVSPLVESHAAAEVMIRGFALFAIAGIAVRAFPGHLGLTPPTVRTQAVVLALFSAGIASWLVGQGPGPLSGSDLAVRAGSIGSAVGLLLFSWSLGLHRLPHPWRGPRYGLLLPAAWLGGLTYGLLLLGWAITGATFDLYEAGAVRHVFLLGFMTPLMVAMAHIVLARFGTGIIPWENALTVAFWLLMATWPMRVIPPLFGEAANDGGRNVMGVGGIVAIVALGLVAVVCLKTAYELRRRSLRAAV